MRALCPVRRLKSVVLPVFGLPISSTSGLREGSALACSMVFAAATADAWVTTSRRASGEAPRRERARARACGRQPLGVRHFTERDRDALGLGAPDGKTAPAHQKLHRIPQGGHADDFHARPRDEPELHEAATKRPFACHVLDGHDLSDAGLCEIHLGYLLNSSLMKTIFNINPRPAPQHGARSPCFDYVLAGTAVAFRRSFAALKLTLSTRLSTLRGNTRSTEVSTSIIW